MILEDERIILEFIYLVVGVVIVVPFQGLSKQILEDD